MNSFLEYVKTLPEKHWAKYDLSAVELGWNARQEYLDIPYFLRAPDAVGEDIKHAFKKLQKRIDELEDREERLIKHAAALGISLVDGDSDLSNESWRSLPQDLMDSLNAATKEMDRILNEDLKTELPESPH